MALLNMIVQRKLDKRLFKGAKAPPAPDPVATANAQKDANIASAQKEAELNRYDQISPFGSTKWSKNGDQWTSTFELSPEIQGMLKQYQDAAQVPSTPVQTQGLQWVGTGDTYRKESDKNFDFGANQQAISQASGLTTKASTLGNTTLDRAQQEYSKNFDYSNLQNKLPTPDEAWRKSVEDAYYNRQISRLDPQYAQAEQEMRTRLQNQGLTEGSEAYNRELAQFMRGRNDAYSTARNDATTLGGSEMQRLFQMQLAGRQNEVGEASYLRDQVGKEAGIAQGLFSGYNDSLNQGLNTQAAMRSASSNIAAQGAAMDQQLRGNQLNERFLLNDQNRNNRQQLLNELIGLTSGSQIQGGGAGQVAVGAAPIAQSIYNSYQGQLQAQAAANQYKSGLIGGLAQAGASAAAAY